MLLGLMFLYFDQRVQDLECICQERQDKWTYGQKAQKCNIYIEQSPVTTAECVEVELDAV